ncbi:MAG: PEGA domain-containing protein [Gemmataceae bacterium]|nr:PEGA domain-containing protein [Gemmataceae bacterium]MDW8267221.1 PEGA domain-containing protein [Gemmataceae bacterium]
MSRYRGLVTVVAAVGLMTGCVERRFVITTDPPGAVVYQNGQPIGATPADNHFVYYGDYEFTIVKDGYETLKVKQRIPAPWYQWIGLDFFSENVIPWRIEDVRRFHYQLQPQRTARADELLHEAELLRQRGQTLPYSETLRRKPADDAPTPTAAP